MKAVLILRHKDVSPEGRITEMVIWRVPQPVKPCTHLFKYSLVLIVNDERVTGFDNERGKGDHYHSRGDERPYLFAGLEKLVDDFIEESEKWKNAH